PLPASRATSTEPSNPPSCFGEARSEYACSPATFVGVAPENTHQEAACVSAFATSSSVGGACCAAPVRAGRSVTYAVFDDASKIVSFDSVHVICASPASDCSSSRPPSAFSQRRPSAPVRRGDPTWPASAPDGSRLFVKWIRAVIPAGAG